MSKDSCDNNSHADYNDNSRLEFTKEKTNFWLKNQKKLLINLNQVQNFNELEKTTESMHVIV